MTSGVYERTPEMRAKLRVPHTTIAQLAADEANSARQRGVPLPPEHIAAISVGIRNSDAVKSANEAQRGGNDIVNHHYIYDESDLSKYTMKMTRSRHTRLHRLMRKSGTIVPHINKVVVDVAAKPDDDDDEEWEE